jgi:uncharacterized protein
MKIGTAESKKGEIAYGRINVGYTMGRHAIDIPVVIVEGLQEGPTLLVNAAIHGAEIIGTLGIHKVLREIDPKQVKGTILFVPVANQGAFEFDSRATMWDGQIMNRQGLGKEDGTITQQLAWHLVNDLILKSDAYVDIHSGTQDSYVYYTIYESEAPGVKPEVLEMAKKMAVAFGLKDIMADSPWKGGYTEEVMAMGVPSIVVEIGGGADFFRNGQQQIATCAQGIRNVAILVGNLEGEIVTESDQVTFWRGEAEIHNDAQGGILLTHFTYGDHMEKGDVWGVMYDPFTGKEIKRLLAPISGTQLPSGVNWPAVKPNDWLSIIGNPMGEGTVKVTDVLTGLSVRVGNK